MLRVAPPHLQANAKRESAERNISPSAEGEEGYAPSTSQPFEKV